MKLFWNLPVKDQFKLMLEHPGCAIIGVLIGFGIAMVFLYCDFNIFNIP